jgi:anaerobic selenocysteine-containing dehydrogenase
VPPKEVPSKAFPLMLTTGRLASQWHTMTRTGKIQRLAKRAALPYIEMHPDDAQYYLLEEGDPVTVESARGQADVKVKFSSKIRPGMVFMPFHWGDLFAPNVAANRLTNDALDPISKEPEYKACAVRVLKAAS